jgi:hypothetical protein
MLGNLQPYKPIVPLSAGARFMRGFTRIGTIAAIVTALIGVPASLMFAVSNYNTAKTTFENAACVAKDVARTGVREWSLDVFAKCDHEFLLDEKPISEVLAIANDPGIPLLDGARPLGIGLIVTGVIAIIFYVGFWTIGWLCAGFTRDPP